MKTFFILVFLALVVSTAFAQYAEAPSGDMEGPSASAGQWGAEVPTMGSSDQCEHDQTKLVYCRDYLMERCTPRYMPITWPWYWMKRSCEKVRSQCCQQLGQMEPKCRCKAISRTIQGELSGFSASQEGQKARVMAMAQRLPSKCNVVPRSCNIPITSGYYW
jgi:hypothetical protein